MKIPKPVTYDSIVEFITIQTRCESNEVLPQSDLGNDLGVDGDDYEELISEYSKQFEVDISGFLWYFHFAEEGNGNSIGGKLFPPPNEHVLHIPVTPVMLLDFAKKGFWDLKYPEHQLPKRRYDLWINFLLIGLFLAFILYKCLS